MSTDSAHTQGYLLIELMIGITMLMICSVFVVQLQAYRASRWHEAEQYLQAVNYAQHVFEKRSFGTQEIDGYRITTVVCPEKEFLYKDIQVKIAWKTTGGIDKHITIYGGLLDEERKTQRVYAA